MFAYLQTYGILVLYFQRTLSLLISLTIVNTDLGVMPVYYAIRQRQIQTILSYLCSLN